MKLSTSRPLLLLLASFLVPSPTRGDDVNHVESIIEWVRGKGGFFNPNIEIRRVDRSDPTSRYGMFANGNLEHKERLFHIPRECLVTESSGDDDAFDEEEEEEDFPLNCRTARNLIEEMRESDASARTPFVNYLLAEPWSHLPSSWSVGGKKTLGNMLKKYTKTPLPPQNFDMWTNYYWRQQCKGSTDPFEENAALIVVQRSWDDVLIPVYDMLSHRNGKYLNTEDANVHHSTKPIKVRASRAIEAGEEIYTSYNMCKDCGNRHETYGTPQIFSDYGFVEQYPQRWILGPAVFDIKEAEGGGLEVDADEYTQKNIEYMRGVQSGMKEAAEALKTVDIPKNEMASILLYNEALIKGSTLFLEAALDLTLGDEL
eukprot:CAMPEP_0194280678 /NCGR_PEP_ID=MMETSP0169-20130528/18302_1 /TAXON_ID=218684 /ORGANISM="Corethron pennatum, Strain L29A3" /LENGTH=371 /DNA_ID=CAMNT_0039025485 /DNA_START=21 /DNA_END=1136 /DNA_ORIENTATION=+